MKVWRSYHVAMLLWRSYHVAKLLATTLIPSSSSFIVASMLQPVVLLGLVTLGAELSGVTCLAKAINYPTFKGWRPVEGISHFAERILYCKRDIKNSELGRIEKSCVLL